MAVFTTVTAAELAPWLAHNYNLQLQAEPLPITEGIENTNYLISCTNSNKYIFTVIEVWDQPMAEFCLRLAVHLNGKGQPVPRTLINHAASPCSHYAGKPAAVVEFVTGHCNRQPDVAACREMGATVANLHAAATDFTWVLPNRRGADWRIATATKVRPGLDPANQRLLDTAMAMDAEVSATELPTAACHCDLFRNNVLWCDGQVAGIIDFYFSGHDRLLFDLAVTCNDWCIDDTGTIDPVRLEALVAAYRQRREFTVEEHLLLPQAFVAAALRFWLSRHLDLLEPRLATTLVAHDPTAFQARLATVMDNVELLRSVAAEPA